MSRNRDVERLRKITREYITRAQGEGFETVDISRMVTNECVSRGPTFPTSTLKRRARPTPAEPETPPSKKRRGSHVQNLGEGDPTTPVSSAVVPSSSAITPTPRRGSALLDDGDDVLDALTRNKNAEKTPQPLRRESTRNKGATKAAPPSPTKRIKIVTKPKAKDDEGKDKEDKGKAKDDEGKAKEDKGKAKEDKGKAKEDKGKGKAKEDENSKAKAKDDEKVKDKEDKGKDKDDKGKAKEPEKGKAKDNEKEAEKEAEKDAEKENEKEAEKEAEKGKE